MFPSIYNNKLLKVFFGSGITSIVKLITTILLSKIVAVQLGPSGLGLIGQFASFVSLVLIFANGGFLNGIVTNAANTVNKDELTQFIQPSLKLTLIISSILGGLLIILAPLISQYLYKSSDYEYLFYLFGATIILYSFNNFFNSFLNGISDIKTYNILNVLNSIFSFTVSVVLIYFYGLKGALLSVILSQTLNSIFSFYYLLRYKVVFFGFLKSKINIELINKLVPFIKMTFFSMLLLPLSQFLIRVQIEKYHGSIQMGLWEALNRISGVYLMVILNVLILYFLPKFSQINKKIEVMNEIKKASILFCFVFILIGVTFFFTKDTLISLFLSKDFLKISDYMLIQILGDLFRVIQYLFCYFIISKSLIKYYFISELLFFLVYISISYASIPAFGVKGTIYAYAIMNLFALIFHFVFVGKIYFEKQTRLRGFLFGNSVN